MWVCPTCKVCMKLDEEVCIKCRKQLQYFENMKHIRLEKMFIQVKLSEYYDILSKQANLRAEKVKKETYWMCPRGCSDKKIKFSGTCRVCYEKFMYFVLEKRMRT